MSWSGVRRIAMLAATLPIWLAMWLAAAPAGATAASALAPPPGVRIGQLPNGLTYYVERSAQPAGHVELRLAVKAGARMEGADQRGAAHLLEHLAYRRSAHFAQGEMLSYLKSLGLKPGADMNATTSHDATVYAMAVPVAPDLDRAFLVMADWAAGTRIDDSDVDNERPIVLEELRLRAGYQRRLRQGTMALLAPQAPLLAQDPAGTAGAVRHLDAAVLRDFHRTWYRPSRMAVFVVGDVPPDEAEQYIRRHFGALADPDTPLPPVQPVQPVQPLPGGAVAPATGSGGLAIVDPDAGGNPVQILFAPRQLAVPDTVADYRQVLVRALLVSIVNARLARLADGAHAPFLGATGGFAAYPLGPRYRGFRLSARAARGGHLRAVRALALECERLGRHGVTAPELARAASEVLAAYRRAQARSDNGAGQQAAEYLRHFLEGERVLGIDAEYRLAAAGLPTIGTDELLAAARAAMPPDGPRVAVVASNTALPPGVDEGALMAALEEVRAGPVPAWSMPPQATGAAPWTRPTGGRIVTERADAVLGLVHLRFANGVAAVLKRTDFTADQVLAGAVRPGGQLGFPASSQLAALHATGAVAAMGTQRLSPDERQQAGAQVSAGMQLTESADQVQGRAPTAGVEALLQLIVRQFAPARHDPVRLQAYLERQAELAQGRKDRPEQRLEDARSEALFGNQPRRPAGPEPDRLRTLGLDELAAIYDARFGSARDMTFFFIGDIDIGTLKPLLADYLGTLPVAALPASAPEPPRPALAGMHQRTVGGAGADRGVVSLDFSGATTFSLAERVRFGALLDALNLRLLERLRDEEHLVYSATATGQLRRTRDAGKDAGPDAGLASGAAADYALSVRMACPDSACERVATAALQEAERLRSGAVSAADLRKITSGMLQSHAKSVRQNDFVLRRLMAAALNGTDPHDELVAWPATVAQLTAAQIQAAAVRYLDPARLVQVILTGHVPLSQ